MGRKKQGNGRDSNPKRLGVKASGGQTVKAGSIIVRQRGMRIVAGRHTMIGRDHTISSLAAGIVEFTGRKGKRVANVVPVAPTQ